VTAPTAANIALADQVLAYLAGQAPLPVSTPVIHAALQGPPCRWPHDECRHRHVDYLALYRVLCRLAQTGQVEKWDPAEDRRTCLWRRLTLPPAVDR
jgi:hypothetical protein